MKNSFVFLLLLCLIFVINCSTQAVKEGTEIQKQPDWVQNMGVYKAGIGAVGSAPVSPLGTQSQRNTAIMQARSELARQIQSRVKSAIEQSVEQLTTSTKDQAELIAKAFDNQVTSNMTNQALSGSHPIKQWKDPENGELFVWVVIDSEKALSDLRSSLHKTLEDSSIRHKETIDLLERRLSKNLLY
jgi:hypothetical protein